MKTYELDDTGAVEALMLWPAAEVKTLYSKMRQAQNFKQLVLLVCELGQYMAYSELIKYYPDEGLADQFNEFPLCRRVEIIQKEKASFLPSGLTHAEYALISNLRDKIKQPSGASRRQKKRRRRNRHNRGFDHEEK